MNAALRHDAPSGNAPDKAAQDNMPGNNAQQDAPQDDAAQQDALPQDAAASEKGKIDNRARLQEITAVLRKHRVTRGVTPEKLRAILEELGPTYVKLGQIMSLHSDVLPQRYCDERSAIVMS